MKSYKHAEEKARGPIFKNRCTGLYRCAPSPAHLSLVVGLTFRKSLSGKIENLTPVLNALDLLRSASPIPVGAARSKFGVIEYHHKERQGLEIVIES
jgi:hypothetical protein